MKPTYTLRNSKSVRPPTSIIEKLNLNFLTSLSTDLNPDCHIARIQADQ